VKLIRVDTLIPGQHFPDLDAACDDIQDTGRQSGFLSCRCQHKRLERGYKPAACPCLAAQRVRVPCRSPRRLPTRPVSSAAVRGQFCRRALRWPPRVSAHLFSRPASRAPTSTSTGRPTSSTQRCSPMRCRVFVNAGSPRVRMGLGTIARIVASGGRDLCERSCGSQRHTRRIDGSLSSLSPGAGTAGRGDRGVFGGYLLVDCHSMPSAAGSACGRDGVDIVLGDCHWRVPALRRSSRACHSVFSSERGLRRRAQRAICRRVHDRLLRTPSAHRHALQIRDQPRALYG